MLASTASVRSAWLSPASRSSAGNPSGVAEVAITAVPEAAHRAATTESIAAASGPPWSTSSTTISRGPADARCRAALSRSSGPASAPSSPAASSSGPPASRSSCAQIRRPGWPEGGEPRSTSNPRRRASPAAASASAVLPDPEAPTKVSRPPAPPAARSSSRPASRSSRPRPTTDTPQIYRALPPEVP